MGLRNMPVRAALLAASALALSGCLLSPGKFSSELQLMKDGNFSYSYDGEIQMLGLSKLAELGNSADETFTASCWDDETFEDRDCTAEEEAEQRKEWEANAAERAESKKREAEEMKALFGGIDPTNPEAASEFADRLERQRGWSNVTHLGDGLYDVEFRVSGKLSHDFAFPTIEKLPFANMFVTVVLRDEAQVRIDAPGFAAGGGEAPMQGMMTGMAGLANLGENKEGGTPARIVLPDGTFTIVTDGRILANNTDEGPASHASGQMLRWTINQRTQQAPTALIAFD